MASSRTVHYWVQSVDGGDGIAAHVRAMIETLRHLQEPTINLHVGVKAQAGGMIWALGALLRCLWRRPDAVLVSHVNFAPLAWLGWLLGRVPFVVTVHAHEINENIRWYRKRALRAASTVIAVSDFSKSKACRVGVPEARVAVVPNTIDFSLFSPGEKPRNLKERYSLDPSERVLLTVARLEGAEQYKGYDRVIEALPALQSRVGPVRYLLVGKGSDMKRVLEKVTALGLADSVLMPGYVAPDELPAHYQVADLFVMPSTGEGFGIVFLEAMACGLPVVGGQFDGAACALAKGDLGRLVDPLDVPGLAEAIGDLLLGQGSPVWFSPTHLREEAMARFGPEAHQRAVRTALSGVFQ